MKFRLITAMLAAMITLTPAWAVAGEPASAAVIATLKKALEQPEAGLTVATVEASEIDGLYAVQFANGPLVYADASGKYFVVGDMFSTGPDGFVNLAEKRRDGERKDQMAGLDPKDLIVFPAQGERKATISVFTDVTCFYCQKLHKEVPALNKRGVEVRYLAYPRAGVGSDAYRQLASAWCAKNPQDAITKLKNRKEVEDNVCPGNPVSDQYQLGMEMGVRGTPAIVTDTGMMIPGYQSADELMVSLGLAE